PSSVNVYVQVSGCPGLEKTLPLHVCPIAFRETKKNNAKKKLVKLFISGLILIRPVWIRGGLQK
ncbi:MAG: hypothetical protein R3182_13770, partial [Draconibacterium sp.]|nr:hypothetical protein [Draconibacterium sp.]